MLFSRITVMTKKSKIGVFGRALVLGVKISTSINERVMNHYINAIKTTTKATSKAKAKRTKKFPKKREYTAMPVLSNTFYVLHSSGMDNHSSVLLTGIEQSVFYTKAGNVRKQFSQYLTQEKENQTKFGKNLFVFADKIEQLIPVLEKKTGFTFGGHFKMSKNSKGATIFSFFSNHHITMTKQSEGNTKPEGIENDTKSSVFKKSESCCDEVV